MRIEGFKEYSFPRTQVIENRGLFLIADKITADKIFIFIGG